MYWGTDGGETVKGGSAARTTAGTEYCCPASSGAGAAPDGPASSGVRRAANGGVVGG
ncbi:UNVERIFIED_CONTAM: hypothetical protein Sradi_0465600 [Sesamum radiatum]|uniref:Uncharacterized protein n=1 Tax=Sesamum radiatum TaxID=300843 RepID=A0AAW2W6V0_SESRA